MRRALFLAGIVLAVSGCLGSQYETTTTVSTTVGRPQCEAPSECAARMHASCLGLWACEAGRCIWRCSVEGEPTTTMGTSPDGPRLLSFHQSPCPDDYGAGRYGNEVSAVRTDDGTIEVSHLLDYVCCANVTVSMNSTVDGGVTINLIERNVGGMCRCICGYNVTTRVGGLPSDGRVIVNVYGVEYDGQQARLLGSGALGGAAQQPERCGGEGGLMCRGGYVCRYGANAPKDAEGVCVKDDGGEGPDEPIEGTSCGGFQAKDCGPGFVCMTNGLDGPGRCERAGKRDAVGLGMMCGGIAGFRCESGLECRMAGSYPDASGTCVLAGQAPECVKDSDCVVGGCSAQLCSPKAGGQLVSTCEYRKEYSCYRLASCGCVSGDCVWGGGPEFDSCMIEASAPGGLE